MLMEKINGKFTCNSRRSLLISIGREAVQFETGHPNTMKANGESTLLLMFGVESCKLDSDQGSSSGLWRLNSGHRVKTGLPCCLETVPLRVIYVHPSLLKGKNCVTVCQIGVNK